MTFIINAALCHARTVLAILCFVLVVGGYSYFQIAKEAEPNVNIPIIYVSMSHDGISPEDAERLLIRPVEQELNSIDGVKEMRATGFEGGANVTLEFEAGFNADDAMKDVREKIDLVKPELPDGTDEPEIHEVNFSLFPVVVVTLSGTVPDRALMKVAHEVKERIESLGEVLGVQIAGKRDELVEILIDPIKAESYGLSVIETVEAVRNSNLLVAAGAQDTGLGRFTLKVPGLFENVHDVVKMPILVDGDAVVTLGDIGTVRRGYKDPNTYARVDGESALALEVTKRTGENIIDTVKKVKSLVKHALQGWPKLLRQSLQVGFFNDRSGKIRDMLRDLQNNVIAAILLVMIVVVWVLGVRSAALVGIAIPGSFLTGILVLSAAGLTINIVVLFALILAVGMLVDGAIVVTEYADRQMCIGEGPSAAYGLAARRMSWPITTSAATTLAAFLPLMFWPGVVGEFMKFLPLTLIATLTASLVMALIFIPTLGSVMTKTPSSSEITNNIRHLASGQTGSLEKITGFTGIYLRFLAIALRHPSKVLIMALALLIGVQIMYAMFGRGIEFFPQVEPTRIKLQIKARGNLAVNEKDELIREVEWQVLKLDTELGEFTAIYSRTGSLKRSKEAEDIIGNIDIELNRWWLRRKADEILNDLAERTNDIAGIIVDLRQEKAGPPIGKSLQIKLGTRFPELLNEAVIKVREGLEEIGGFRNIEDDRPLPGIDWEFNVDRAQAAKFAVDVKRIGRSVRLVTTGIKLGDYRPFDSDDEIDIRVRYPKAYRTINQLDHIRAETPLGAVPISNFVQREPRPNVGKIKRSDGLRVMGVRADVAPGLLADNKTSQMRSWVNSAGFDPRVYVTFKGESEEQGKAKIFLGKAFAVALFIMAVILVTQFNSFYSAFLILTAVIMSTTGVFIGLLATAQPFGIVMGGIGVIALAGIVVNNNIVLIDTFDRLKLTESSIRDAILKTGAQRLRPVLLTTITTILGLMPMVLGINIDFLERVVTTGAPAMQWWRQLATSIVFGLGFATLLTLLVTPSALMVRNNLRTWLDDRSISAKSKNVVAE